MHTENGIAIHCPYFYFLFLQKHILLQFRRFKINIKINKDYMYMYMKVTSKLIIAKNE